MESDNLIIKALSKTLKSEIKFISIADIKCFNSENKDLENSGREWRRKTILLGTEKVFILNEGMTKKYEVVPYDLLSYIELDLKNKETFSVFVKPNTIMKNSWINKICIKSLLRGVIIKNFMCYYSIYYMHRFCNVRSLSIKEGSHTVDKKEAQSEEVKGFSKFKTKSLKSYNFFIYGNILNEYNNVYYKIKYSDLDKPDESYNSECEVDLEISDVITMKYFDSHRDDRDLSYFAYNSFTIYMKSVIKSNRFWVTKNKIFNKKYNLVEDSCQWEGWTIEARCSDPFFKNYIFIFLRRKFIPPFYDSFQTFRLILSEEYTNENYEINPLSFKLIGSMASSLHYANSVHDIRDSALLLKAKVDSLSVDEESLYYYQFSNKIIGEDVHKFGFDFIFTLFSYFEISMKEKIEPYKLTLLSKFKQYELEGIQKWSFEKKNYEFLKKVEEFIELNCKIQNDENDEIRLLKDNFKSSTETEENQLPDLQQISTPHDGKKPGLKMSKYSKINWRSKVMRFLYYCLNGGLTDFMLTFERFITEIYNKNQTANNDLQELIFNTINILEYGDDTGKFSKEKLATLSESSKFSFNEEALSACIKTGFLSKILSDNYSTFPKFIGLVITKYCSNKILNALLDYLKIFGEISGNESILSDERKALIHLISPLLQIFCDRKRSPSTLALCCKCLILTVYKKSDEVFRKKILFEGKIVSIISSLLDEYDYDEKLILSMLELFSFVMNEPEATLVDNLYGHPDRLFDRLKKFLEPTGVPGIFYSQRLIIKVLTIFLNLTNKIEAEIKAKINSQYKSFYDLVLRLINDSEKYTVLDKREEESYILEFKTFWLLCVLTFKNSSTKEYLKSIGIKKFIEEKSKKYNKLVSIIAVSSKKIPEGKIAAISKNISKFFEFVYYLIISDRDDIVDYRSKMTNFNSLKKKVEENKQILVLNEKESLVFDWIEKIYKMTDDDYL